jgi:hypothetical protein
VEILALIKVTSAARRAMWINPIKRLIHRKYPFYLTIQARHNAFACLINKQIIKSSSSSKAGNRQGRQNMRRINTARFQRQA